MNPRFRLCFAVPLLLCLATVCATAQEQARTERNIEYARVDDFTLKLDLYLPGKTQTKPPLLVWIHGGGWRYGSKDNCPLRWLVEEGYAVASIQYRLTRTATFPAQIHDCKGALRWLRAHAAEYGYNAERIGVAGGSAGGHLVALLGTSAGVKQLEGNVGGNLEHSSRVQAVYNLFGPTDLTKIVEQGHGEFATSLTAFLLDDPISTRMDLARLASPVTHVTEDDAPLLTLHGDQDPVVKVAQAHLLHEAYSKAGLETTLDVIPGAGHGGGQFQSPERIQQMRDFFARHVRTASADDP